MAVRDIIQAAGGSAATSSAVYVEDVFSTYLYTGTGASQTITNGIDLDTKGGMVWTKIRSSTGYHNVFDTVRGATNRIYTNDTSASVEAFTSLTAFNTNGFTIGASTSGNSSPGDSGVSWTFRKQAKFFDVQAKSHTNGSASTVDLSALGTVGMVIVKRTDSTSDWYVWHRSLTSGNNIALNTTAAQTATNAYLSVSGTTLTLSSSTPTGSYIIYAYAHDAGGFGAAGTDSVVACGVFNNNSGVNDINLGWEPQFIIARPMNSTNSWIVLDTMRGASNTNINYLFANGSNAEGTSYGEWIVPRATGFSVKYGWWTGSGEPIIYLAIRRGPMKTPTDATKVFAPVTGDDNSPMTTGFPVDMLLVHKNSPEIMARMTGNYALSPHAIYGQLDYGAASGRFDANTTTRPAAVGTGALVLALRRAPGFFDVVCYTGTGANRTVAHNLGVTPELIIVKKRDAESTTGWLVYSATTGNTNAFYLNLTNATASNATAWNNTSPTSSAFSIGTNADCNASASTYIAYLFASCPGVSKVGSYIGSGTTKQIDCGFTAGARFVMIKRTDSTGDWYVWDTARGIVSGNDPYLLLNVSASGWTTTDYIDPYSAGFEISSTAPPAINASGGTFIYLAIA